jgi:uncharacterized protein involved in type VI secretion and phage assembly
VNVKIDRAAWQQAVRASYGLVALAQTVDDLAGTALSMDRDELDHFHGLVEAMQALAREVHGTIDAMNDADILARLTTTQEQT